MPAAAAALLVEWLERRGAVVILTEGDCVSVDLDPIRDFGATTSAMLAHAVLGLAGEIRQILRARRTLH